MLFDKFVGLGSVYFFYKCGKDVLRYVMSASIPYFFPIHSVGLGVTAYYLLNRSKEAPITEIIYSLKNHKILLKTFQSN